MTAHAFAQMIYYLANRLDGLTGGDNGRQDVPPPLPVRPLRTISSVDGAPSWLWASLRRGAWSASFPAGSSSMTTRRGARPRSSGYPCRESQRYLYVRVWPARPASRHGLTSSVALNTLRSTAWTSRIAGRRWRNRHPIEDRGRRPAAASGLPVAAASPRLTSSSVRCSRSSCSCSVVDRAPRGPAASAPARRAGHTVTYRSRRCAAWHPGSQNRRIRSGQDSTGEDVVDGLVRLVELEVDDDLGAAAAVQKLKAGRGLCGYRRSNRSRASLRTVSKIGSLTSRRPAARRTQRPAATQQPECLGLRLETRPGPPAASAWPRPGFAATRVVGGSVGVVEREE